MVRFGLAGAILLTLSCLTGSLRRMPRRTVLAALSMGTFGYAVQAGLYLAAVSRVDASQVTLVFSVYPVLVMAAAIAIGRDRASARRLVALVTALGGIVFVLGGATTGSFDGVGAVLSLGSALVYTCYILVGDRVVADARPVPFTALVCAGAFVSCTAVSLGRGDTSLAFTAAGWWWLVVLVLVSTVGAILLFFAGLTRVGPSVTSLLSAVEPVVTVAGAAVVFGEQLGAIQLVGGVLVLAAVVLVQWPSRRCETSVPTVEDRCVGRMVARAPATKTGLDRGPSAAPRPPKLCRPVAQLAGSWAADTVPGHMSWVPWGVSSIQPDHRDSPIGRRQ
jgi:drug/metabolite transporter (DMT)-like permease